MKTYTSKAGRSNIYDFDFEVSQDIKTIQSLIEALEKPHILTTEWHPISSPVYPDYNFIWTDMLKHILGEYEEILAASDEDVAWTEQRNKDYLYVAFRKVTFKPETQKRLRAYLQAGMKDVVNRSEWTEEEASLIKWLVEFGEFRGSVRM